jgi:hypothetical protein
MTHATFCRPALHSETVCVGRDVSGGGKWIVGVASEPGEGATVFLWHPDKLSAEEQGALSVGTAWRLGFALIYQAARATWSALCAMMRHRQAPQH